MKRAEVCDNEWKTNVFIVSVEQTLEVLVQMTLAAPRGPLTVSKAYVMLVMMKCWLKHMTPPKLNKVLLHEKMNNIWWYFPWSSGSSGILEFALIYDEINQLLLVNILRAKVRLLTEVIFLNKLLTDINHSFQHLRGLDVNGLCDSYCKITLQPAIKNVSLFFQNPLENKEKCLRLISKDPEPFQRTRRLNIRVCFTSLAWIKMISQSFTCTSLF